MAELMRPETLISIAALPNWPIERSLIDANAGYPD